jgi:hypothetical protein
MAQLGRILRQLRAQRAGAQAEVDRLDRAIEALSDVERKAGRAGVPTRGGPRHMSAAARKRIADAQRARWAKIRAAKAAKQ